MGAGRLTADIIARAIVAAAQETGEDPIDCVSGVMGVRCRHYALHALAHVFEPKCREDRETLARVVGCPGKPLSFWNNSKSQVYKPFFNSVTGKPDGYWAKWFDDCALARVIAAIRAVLPEQSAPAPVLPANGRGEISPSPRPDTQIPVTMRRTAARSFVDVTAPLMGDPPPGRSALDHKRGNKNGPA